MSDDFMMETKNVQCDEYDGSADNSRAVKISRLPPRRILSYPLPGMNMLDAFAMVMRECYREDFIRSEVRAPRHPYRRLWPQYIPNMKLSRCTRAV